MTPIQTRIPDDLAAAIEGMTPAGGSTSGTVRDLLAEVLEIRALLGRLRFVSANATTHLLVVEGSGDDLRALMVRLGGD